jgi:hypothetical protein
MAPRWLHSSILGSIALAVVCGCHSGSTDAYPTWAAEPKGFVPKEVSSNAYDAYALAADEAEGKGAAFLDRVSFYPGQKHEAGAAIQDCVQQVLNATKKTCDFEFVSHKPFKAVKYQRGWRLIGRAILWTVEDACQAADYDKAISHAVAGTKFGFDLTGGGATDASLGLGIADDIRKQIAPYLVKMSATQLDTLAKGMKAALDSKPPISNALKNEQENVLQAIQFLQDSLKGGTLKVVQDGLGPDVNEAIRYLEDLAENPRKRTAYFESLAKAADIEYAQVAQDSELPVVSRVKPNTKNDAPWKKLAKYLYGASRPLLEINDATVARTRLLILYAEIDRLGLRNKAYPANLDAFTPGLTIDPYSGSKFLYHADQAEFSIYSVGKNGRDDGGDTDATFTQPDLRLECPT